MAKKDRPAAVKRTPAQAVPAARPQATLDDIPGWAPAVLYAVVTVVIYREFILGSAGLLGVDTLGLSYFARNFYTEFVHAFHRFPMWQPLL